jgi:hypothetical protein
VKLVEDRVEPIERAFPVLPVLVDPGRHFAHGLGDQMADVSPAVSTLLDEASSFEKSQVLRYGLLRNAIGLG